MVIISLDHLVLTVESLEESLDFYTRVLGMEEVSFAGGRKALKFGNQKINLHETQKPFRPNAAKAISGSADLCFLSEVSLQEIEEKLVQENVSLIEGPVERTGAQGPLMSLYIRDPDGNLIEISNQL